MLWIVCFGTEILDIQVSHCGWQDQYKEAERSIQSKKVTEFQSSRTRTEAKTESVLGRWEDLKEGGFTASRPSGIQ